LITIFISGSTVLSSMFSARILSKLGTPVVTALSTALTAVALLGFSFAPSIYWMIPLAIALGLGAGAIDAGLNNYVAMHFSARQMNFLHGFYGIGVTLSPYIMSLAISHTGWRAGYRYAALIQLFIGVLVLVSLRLWKKDSTGENAEQLPQKTLSFIEMLRTPGLIAAWVIMIATNAIEYSAGVWGGTYLANSYGFSAEDAAAALSLYYAGLAIGRLLSGIVSSKIKTFARIGIGMGIVLCAVTVLLLPLPAAASVVGLALIGLGNGSIYPNFMHLTPYNFGSDRSQSVMGSLIAFAYLGVMIAPPIVGLVTSGFGINVYPIILAFLFVLMMISTAVFIMQLKKQNKLDTTI
jgi:fucose permease